MGKIPYSNPLMNDNPNPKKKRKHQKPFAPGNGVFSRHYQNVDSPVVTPTVSEDAYSFNQTSTSHHDGNYGGYLTYNVSTYSKSELRELRKRWSVEIEQIRDLRRRIESGQLINTGNPRPLPKFKNNSGNKKATAALGSIPNRVSNGIDNGNHNPATYEHLLKECRQIVAKLMKHKFAYVFKAPVDAAALGLHDYHHIVNRPMDLGTVKANLSKNLYGMPTEFAADVRLTFNNALLYNPKHDPVHGMAQQMLLRFEELFMPIQAKIQEFLGSPKENEFREFRNDELHCSSWKQKGSGSPVPAPRKPERTTEAQTHSSASTPSNPPHSQPMNHQPLAEQIPSPVRAAPLPAKEQKSARVGPAMTTVKQPKPKAKDPNKRPMSMEEKQKLGFGLQSLPQEKMPQLIQIIRRRNDHLAQEGDEIELDIEALDTETVWELDRFVTNWRKFVSKTKRQALMTNSQNGAAPGLASSPTPINEADMGAICDRNDELEQRSNDNDEDVDIEDDMPATNFPPVEIEKDEGPVLCDQERDANDSNNNNDVGNPVSSSSSSGSSSSDSSSTSDSGSGSSSRSDSDADDAQS